MKKILLLIVVPLFLVWASIAGATQITFSGMNTPVTGTVDFDYTAISPTSGKIDLSVSNTTAGLASFITAIGFNTPANISGISPITAPNSYWSAAFRPDSINTPGNYGFFDLALVTGKNFNGGKVAGGVPTGGNYDFSFLLTGLGLDSLNENSFLSLLSTPDNGASDLVSAILRYQGISGFFDGSRYCDASDVATPAAPVPEPATLLLLGSGLLFLGGLSLRKK